MKVFVALALVAVLCVASVQATPAPLKLVSKPAMSREVGLDLCPFCVQFSGQAINQLLNIILNAGIIGGCGDICGMLPNKLESAACSILCDVVGIKVFIWAIQKADLDPIYFCQLIKTCPVHDCTGTCMKIDALTVSPPSGPAGTTFNIEMQFTVFNETGTGEIGIAVTPADGQTLGDASVVPEFTTGQFAVKFQLSTQPSEQESWDAGTVQVEMALCEGECGSKHPHSAVYDVKQTTFQISQ
jgi:hypothetical protein